MTPERTASVASVELIGYDRAEKPLAVPVPPGSSVVQVEEAVRAAGGRILRSRLRPTDRAHPAGVSAEDFARFNEMLASAVRRGVPMTEGVQRLARDMTSGRFRGALERVRERLARGATLREAFDPEATGFPRLYGRLIEAGAAAGDLAGVLMAFSRNVRVNALFRRGVLEACVYPMLLLAVCIAFLGGLGAALLGRVESVIRTLSLPMPGLTMTVLAQNALGIALWLSVMAAALSALALLIWSAFSPAGRRTLEYLLLRTPLYGRMYEAALWSNAADILALLLRAKTPLPAALRLVGPAAGAERLADAFDRMALEIEKGCSLSAAARGEKDAPARFVRAADAAEISGDLEAAMTALAEDYRRAAERRADYIVRLLPVILTFALGALVFLIALTVFVPGLSLWRAAW